MTYDQKYHYYDAALDKANRDALKELCKAADIKPDVAAIDDQRILEELLRIALLPTEHCLRHRFALNAKLRALELVGKYLKMFVDVQEQTCDLTITTKLENALDRLSKHRASISLD